MQTKPTYARALAHAAAAVALSFGAAACGSSLMVQHERSPRLQGTGHATYAFVPQSVGEVEIAERAVRPVVASSLEARGFREAPRDAADVLVSYKVMTVVDDDAATGNADAPKAVKTVLVLMQDRASLEILWIGWSREEISNDQVEARARAAAEAIVASLPARPTPREPT